MLKKIAIVLNILLGGYIIFGFGYVLYLRSIDMIGYMNWLDFLPFVVLLLFSIVNVLALLKKT